MANKYSHDGIAARYSKQDGSGGFKEEGLQGTSKSRAGIRPRSSVQEIPTKSINERRPHSLHQDTKFRNGIDYALVDSYNRASSIQTRDLAKDGRTGKYTRSTAEAQESPDETSVGTQKSSIDHKTPELTSGSSSLDSSLSSGQSQARREDASTSSALAPRKAADQADHNDEMPASERIGAKVERLRMAIADEPRKSIPRLDEATNAEISRLLRQTTLPRGPPPPSNVRRKDGVEVVEDIRLSSKNTNGTNIANQEAMEVNQLDNADIKPEFVPQRQASPPPAAGYEDTKHIEARAAEKHEPEIGPENVLVGPGHLPESGLVQSKSDSHGDFSMAEPRIVPSDDPATAAKGKKQSSLISALSRPENHVGTETQDAVPPDVARFRSSMEKTEPSESKARQVEIKETERRLEELRALENNKKTGPGILKKLKGPNLRKLKCF